MRTEHDPPTSIWYRRREVRGLAAILALAAFLRFWGIDYGLPYDGITHAEITIEEIQEVHRALKLGAGEYSLVFGKGGLYLILFLEYAALFVVSWMLGWVSGPRDFALQVLENPTVVYLLGRFTVALMGVLTCLVVYLIARRLYDHRIAFFATLIGATSYFHVAYSSVINVDIGCTLALWASMLMYVRYEESGKKRDLVWAGVLGAAAIAFKLPGVVVLPLLAVAMVTAPLARQNPGLQVRRGGLLLLAVMLTLTIIAPEWVSRATKIVGSNFSWLLPSQEGDVGAINVERSLDEDIASITIHREAWRPRYVEHLLKPYNVALLTFALLGIFAGVIRKHRWDAILSGLIVLFIGLMSLSDRTQAERYLLPVMPAIWLLGARGVRLLAKDRLIVALGTMSVVLAMPAYSLARYAVEKTKIDTRILAKFWIESNLPSESRVLMDGMRYRFSQSPPLNPTAENLRAKVERAGTEGRHRGRGLSTLALSVYEEAIGNAAGPRYELVSTVHGLQVRDLDHYIGSCFDYIVTSSMIAGRFEPGGRARAHFPQSARFYDSLDTDPRARLLHEEAPIPWKSSGPTIRIYALPRAPCERSS